MLKGLSLKDHEEVLLCQMHCSFNRSDYEKARMYLRRNGNKIVNVECPGLLLSARDCRHSYISTTNTSFHKIEPKPFVGFLIQSSDRRRA